eukprot:m.84510 g.84510  ORF g.84510 m.84510 type:complete len:625 (-) comp17803_c0_seq1:57-1931(-)
MTNRQEFVVDVDLAAEQQLSGTDKLEAIDLSFEHIQFSVKLKTDKKENKVLLNDISGLCKAGEITAIAGQSGAGKSTLLDVLAGRIPSEELDGGVVKASGRPISNTFRKNSGYVMQDDLLYPLLTVMETLQYTAKLRCRLPEQARNRRIASILEQLSLTDSAATIIGDNDRNRGISGGQKRRVSIAQEMIRNPSVIFMDEVTSGLDSSTAFNVMQLLQNIARQDHRTIILTIHQPSARLLTLLDRLMIVSAGSLVYNGPVDQVFPYFASIGFGDAGLRANSLEFALDTVERETNKENFRDGAVKLIAKYREVEQGLQSQLHQTQHVDNVPRGSTVEMQFEHANSFWNETKILLSRTLLNNLRTKSVFITRLSSFLSMSFVIGTLFLNAGKEPVSYSDATSLVSYAAFSSAVLIFTTTEALPVFLMERTIFTRETARGAYRASSYALSSFIAAMPFLLVLAFTYTLPSFLLVGLRGWEEFFFQVIQLFAILLAANGFVVMWSAVLPDFISGNSAVTAMFAAFFLFGGFFASRSYIIDSAPWWIWMHYISIFKYALDGVLLNSIDENQTVGCPSDSAPDCVLTGKDFHQQYGVDQVSMWLNPLILLGFAVVFRVIFFLILRRMVKK